MKKEKPCDKLKNAIHLLEEEQTVKRQLLKNQLLIAADSLKPVNIIKHTLKDVSSGNDLISSIIVPAVSFAAGSISKTIFVGSSGNIIRKIMGSVLQMKVTDTITKHPDIIKSLGAILAERFFPKKEQKPL
ncbi:MAG: hypothetical protein A2W91_08425 [Bacteroidetes bacterium GWF2_38_335]|nr:MAG: hypothetical protein A2W91_08425 [Bacteroidetes bacterium GWF2_38_335]